MIVLYSMRIYSYDFTLKEILSIMASYDLPQNSKEWIEMIKFLEAKNKRIYNDNPQTPKKKKRKKKT